VRKVYFILCIGVAGLLTGCLLPHESERSPQVRGRVADSQTGASIAGAKVRWMEQSSPSAVTGADGIFHLPATKNLHVLSLGHYSWPNFGRRSDYLFITHSDYYPTGVYGFTYVTNRIFQTSEIRSISLEHRHE